MKLITWNIQFGVGIDGRKDLARIVAHAKAMADFDVLCLQEVADNFPEAKGSPGENQFAELASLLPGYTAIEGHAVDAPAKHGGRQRFGNLLLSRLPVGQVLRHMLPWETDATRSMPRVLIEAVIGTRFGPVRVMTTHLEYYSAKLRLAEVEAIRDLHRQGSARAARPPRPAPGMARPHPATRSAILTGDCNMPPEDQGYGRLTASFSDATQPLRDAWTVRNPGQPHPNSFCIYEQVAGQPHCCDFIFVTRNLAPRVQRVVYDLETQVSDHQPVLLELAD